MTAEDRLVTVERLARSTAEVVQLQQDLIEELQQTRAELLNAKAAALGARYLAGAALND
jgi:hypothetical protein